MFSLPQRLFTLCLLLIVIGLFRGWFTFSSPDKQGDKVNINVSVDTKRVEADAQKLKEAGARVAQRIKERQEQAATPGQEPTATQGNERTSAVEVTTPR